MRTFLLAIPLCFVAAAACAADLPKVGDTAPEFEMTGTDGKVYKSKDFVGKQAVIVAWFPRADTGGCTKECKSFSAAADQFKQYEVAYFTASNDPVAKNQDFVKKYSFNFPILSDPENKATKAFGVLNEKGTAAKRVTFVIGKNGKILLVDEEVKTETHAEDLIKQLEKLGVPRKGAS